MEGKGIQAENNALKLVAWLKESVWKKAGKASRVVITCYAEFGSHLARSHWKVFDQVSALIPVLL